MPHISVNRYLHPQNKQILFAKGPILDVEISLPLNIGKLRGQPQNIITRALIDTGATISCISPNIAGTLGLNPINQIPLRGVSQIVNANVYVIDFTFPGSGIMMRNWQIAEAIQLTGPDYEMLLGRDVLSNFLFVYDGETGTIGLEAPSISHPLANAPWVFIKKGGAPQRPNLSRIIQKKKSRQKTARKSRKKNR